MYCSSGYWKIQDEGAIRCSVGEDCSLLTRWRLPAVSSQGRRDGRAKGIASSHFHEGA
jgi:hypothetical protein